MNRKEYTPPTSFGHCEIKLTGKWPQISEALRLKCQILECYLSGCSEVKGVMGETTNPYRANFIPEIGQTFDDYVDKLSPNNALDHKTGDTKVLGLTENYLIMVNHLDNRGIWSEMGRIDLHSDLEKNTYYGFERPIEVFSYDLSIWGYLHSLAVVDAISTNLIGYAKDNLNKGIVCVYQVPEKPPFC